jgi:hypothetical protein
MNRFRVAGVVWLAAAVFAIAITLIFRVDPVAWVVTMALGVVAAVLGLVLIVHPGALVTVSNVAAVVWVMLYVVLAVQQADDAAASLTDVALIAIGAAAGSVAYRAGATAKLAT